MDSIDVRSDTVTKPTREMREAMYAAEVGDDGRAGPDGRGEDPTINELEALAAKILGKEDALLVASGTMGNLVALMTHCGRGDEAIVGQTAHIYRNEKGGFAEDLYALQPLEVPDPAGVPDLDALNRFLSTRKPKVFCMENTHNYAGGTVMAPATMRTLAEAARAHGVPVHLDGARIFNAAVALGVAPRVVAEPVDSVQFCLSKGLAAPVGSMLVGSAAFIKKARERRKLVGGGWRQAGVFAAAGIVALKTGVDRMAEDHEKARRLAEKLVAYGGLGIDLASVQSNMVKADVTPLGLTGKEFQAEVRRRGVLLHLSSPTEIRMVAHRDVTMEQVLKAGDIVGQFAAERAGAR